MSYPEREMEVGGNLQETIKELPREDQELLDRLEREILEQLKIIPPEQLAQKLAREKYDQLKQLQKKEEEIAKLQTQVDRDPYNPEVYTENGFFRILSEKLAGLRRSGKKAFMGILDLDRFKEYNDTYGHEAGNVALGLTGEIMKRSVRADEDIVARLHGDEFAYVVTADTTDGAVIAADRMRVGILEIPALMGTSIPLSASTGLVEIPISFIDKDYPRDENFIEAVRHLMNHADKAMYQGTKSGQKNGIGVLLPEGIRTAVVSMGHTTPIRHVVQYLPPTVK